MKIATPKNVVFGLLRRRRRRKILTDFLCLLLQVNIGV